MAKYKFTNKSSTPVTVIGRRKIEIGGLVEGQEIEFSEKDIQKILPILKRKHFLKIQKVEKEQSAETPAADADESPAVATLSATAATAKTERYRKRGRPAKSEAAETAAADVVEG